MSLALGGYKAYARLEPFSQQRCLISQGPSSYNADDLAFLPLVLSSVALCSLCMIWFLYYPAALNYPVGSHCTMYSPRRLNVIYTGYVLLYRSGEDLDVGRRVRTTK